MEGTLIAPLLISLMGNNWWRMELEDLKVLLDIDNGYTYSIPMSSIEIRFWIEDDLLVEFHGNPKFFPKDNTIVMYWI